jgi:serine/threonine protein kinase
MSDFELSKELGSGYSGQVFLAVDKRTGARVAVKKLHSKHINAKGIKSFNREVQVMALVTHPTLLGLYGFVPAGSASGDPPSIITHFAERGSLEDIIKAKKPPADWDATKMYVVLYGVAVGMMELRAKQIIHRDLKPENIFLDDAWEPKVADFRFSKVVDPGMSLNQSAQFGTPLYQAPEILGDEEGQYGFPVDVYSFGVLFNATVTREIPYSHLNITRALTLALKVAKGIRPRIDETINPKWKQLVVQCWGHNPSERPTFSEIVSQMSNHDFIGPKVDVAKFLSYQQKVVPESLWCR